MKENGYEVKTKFWEDFSQNGTVNSFAQISSDILAEV